MKKFVNKTIEQYQLLSQASRSDANTIVASSAASDAAEAADVAAQADASNVQNDAAALSSDFNAQWQSLNCSSFTPKIKNSVTTAIGLNPNLSCDQLSLFGNDLTQCKRYVVANSIEKPYWTIVQETAAR